MSTTDTKYDHQEHGKAYWSKDLGTPQAAIAVALQPFCDEKDCSFDMDWISVGLKGPTFSCSVPTVMEPIVLHVISKQGITIIKNGLKYKFNFEEYMDKPMDFDKDIKNSTLWAFVFFKPLHPSFRVILWLSKPVHQMMKKYGRDFTDFVIMLLSIPNHITVTIIIGTLFR